MQLKDFRDFPGFKFYGENVFLNSRLHTDYAGLFAIPSNKNNFLHVEQFKTFSIGKIVITYKSCKLVKVE